MDQPERLSELQKERILHRLETIRLQGRIQCLTGGLTEEAFHTLELDEIV